MDLKGKQILCEALEAYIFTLTIIIERERCLYAGVKEELIDNYYLV